MGKAWRIIQDWLDSQSIGDIRDSQLARAIGFSQSNFPNWRNPKSLPARETLGAIAKVVERDFFEVRDAFLEDLGYNDPPSDDEIAAAKVARQKRAARSASSTTPLAPTDPAKRNQ